MKELILSKETMSSIEIAELTGKEHKTVMRDIRNLIENLKKNNGYTSVPVEEIKHDYHRGDRTQYKYLSENTMDSIFNFCIGGDNNSEYVFKLSEYTDKKGEKRPQYELNKKSSLLLASGYDILLRARIIDRWEELETQSRHGFQVPSSFSEALMLAAEQQKQIEVQQNQLSAQAPKVLFADAVVASENSILIGRLANVLKQNGIEIGQNRLFKWLRDNGYLCKCGEKYNQPTQMAMELELFEVSYGSIVRADKSINTITTKVTGKGQIYFINKFLKK